ncbi:MAG: hypothetical protein OEL83_08060 [Desulforhopalus sp.]|nr:hypothetical protein [Desulforhopalus sp.]
MSKTIQIWSLLSAIHLGVAALSTILGIDRLSAIIAGTIYLPLWPVDILGLPVFQGNQWMIPPPNALGWILVFVFWALLYWIIAVFLVRIFRMRCRAA